MNPKVLVGCPTADLKEYCLGSYLQRLKGLTYPNFDILLVDNSKDETYSKKIQAYGIPCIRSTYHENIPKRVIEGRNILRKYALEKGYDYFLSLEQDVIPPKDIIEQLLAAQQEIVGGITRHLLVKGDNIQEIALLGVHDPAHPGHYIYINYKSVLGKKGIVPVNYCALGCVLISRKVLEKIIFRYEEFEQKTNELNVKWDDICFCQDAEKEGFKIFAQIDVQCEHLFYGGFSATLGNTKEITKN